MKRIESIAKSDTLRSEIASAKSELALVGIVPLDAVPEIQRFYFKVLDLSQAVLREEEERLSGLGFTHHGAVYGSGGVRKVDVMKKLLTGLTVESLILSDDVARRHFTAISLANDQFVHVYSVKVSENCKLFSMVGDDVYNKKKTKLVFAFRPVEYCTCKECGQSFNRLSLCEVASGGLCLLSLSR